VISTPRDLPGFEHLLGDGSQWGLEISYAEQPKPEGLAQAFLIGEEFHRRRAGLPRARRQPFLRPRARFKSLLAASKRMDGATVFGYHTKEPEQYGVVEFDAAGNGWFRLRKSRRNRSRTTRCPASIFTTSNVVATAKSLKPSPRGELEITDLNRLYLERGELRVELLGRGTTWLDTGTPDSLADATQFVQVIQQRQGLKIACPEEIAFLQGPHRPLKLGESVAKYAGTPYGEYLPRSDNPPP
jgi:glucose-1-phosphate thymidylyltransferase